MMANADVLQASLWDLILVSLVILRSLVTPRLVSVTVLLACQCQEESACALELD